MTKYFDEKMNERMSELSYALAERQILENTLTSIRLALTERDGDGDFAAVKDPWLNFDLKELLRECYEEAMTTVYGEEK